MAHQDDVIDLRRKVIEATRLGIVDEKNSDITQAILIQILNEAETRRQKHKTAAERMRQQAANEEGQANALSQISSIVSNVLYGFITQEHKALEEDTEREDELKEEDAE